LQIDIDFPAEPVPAMLELSAEGYWLIPTQKSNLEVLQRTLTDLPLRELVDEGVVTLRTLRGLAESEDLARAVAQSDELAAEMRAMVQRLDGAVGRLEGEFSGSAEAVRALADQGAQSLARVEGDAALILGELRATVGAIDTAVQANAQRFGNALAAAERTLDESAVLLAALNGAEGRESALARDLVGTLRSAARALDALRALADYLERHPEALLRGKD